MDEITFTGILGWIIGGLFVLLVLFLGLLIALEMVWRTLAIREKKKLLKRWAKKYDKDYYKVMYKDEE